MFPVGVQAGGIHFANPAQHPQSGGTRLGQLEVLVIVSRHPVGLPYTLDKQSGSPFALTEARAVVDLGPAGLQRRPQLLVAG